MTLRVKVSPERLVPHAALVLGTVVLVGCASAGSPMRSADSEDHWRLSGDDTPTQRILRVHYDGPEGEGTLKITLRLESSERFHMTAVDRLGRRWWGLGVDGNEATLVDFREKTYCRYRGEIEISAIPLGPLPFKTLPALLLGKLPVAAGSSLERHGGELSFQDRHGRHWTATVDSRGLANWTLWSNDEPAVYWLREGRHAYLSARREELQLRWQQVVQEKMTQPLDLPGPPAGFVAGACT